MKSDAQVQQDVIAELRWEPSVNATQIGVAVKDGIVSLTGTVNSYAEKWDAERATQRVAGVKALACSIGVTLFNSHKRSDAEIARAVEDVLQWTTYLPKDSVQVMVEDGWVTLSGELDWEYQRRAAANALRYLIGVTGLTDLITMRPRATSRAIKTDIEAALKRRAKEDANSISVMVEGADVTLSGTVHSLSERELVKYSAWGTPGVGKVVDNLVIAY